MNHDSKNAGISGPQLNILHLGAGNCSELEAYLAAKPQRVILVEANPAVAAGLQRRVDALPPVRVVPAAVAANPGPATLKVLNVRPASSLRVPTALHRLFPSVRIDKEVDVDAITPAQLVEELALSPDQTNRLVIDLPGEELGVVKALGDTGHLSLFEDVILYCGKAPLYEGGSEATAVLRYLAEHGYEITAHSDETDPDRPQWMLHRNGLRLENEELKQRLEAAAVQAADGQAELEKLKQEHNAQAKLAAERQAELEKLKQERDAQAKLAAERQVELEKLKQQRDAQTKLAADRQAELLRLNRQNQELSARLTAAESKGVAAHDRQDLLAREMLRAEAQLDLIKDVLLRDPAL